MFPGRFQYSTVDSSAGEPASALMPCMTAQQTVEQGACRIATMNLGCNCCRLPPSTLPTARPGHPVVNDRPIIGILTQVSQPCQQPEAACPRADRQLCRQRHCAPTQCVRACVCASVGSAPAAAAPCAPCLHPGGLTCWVCGVAAAGLPSPQGRLLHCSLLRQVGRGEQLLHYHNQHPQPHQPTPLASWAAGDQQRTLIRAAVRQGGLLHTISANRCVVGAAVAAAAVVFAGSWCACCAHHV